MAIPKISSRDMNDTLKAAEDMVERVQARMVDIERDVIMKTSLLRNQQEFIMEEIHSITELVNASNGLRSSSNKTVFSKADIIGGNYEKYGDSVHQKFLRTPLNIFNLMTVSGPMFRDNIDIGINGTSDALAKSMVMHSSYKKKSIYFEEFIDSKLNLVVEVDRSNLLGDTSFNVIELNPFLKGSFNINSIKVYEINSPGVVSLEIKDLSKIGKTRFVLDRKYQLSRIEFEIELLFQNSNERFPFGLDTLYFLNADFEAESNIVIKKSELSYIEYISDAIVIRDQSEKREASIADEGIRVFINHSDGIFENEVIPSVNEEVNYISRNTKDLYFNIPLKGNSLKSIEFISIATRQR